MAVLLGLSGLSFPTGLSPVAAAPEQPVGVWPLEPEPEVVQGFSPPPHPYAPGHRGVDLAGRPGQAVRAALPGIVGFAGSIAGKPVVTVLHGGRVRPTSRSSRRSLGVTRWRPATSSGAS